MTPTPITSTTLGTADEGGGLFSLITEPAQFWGRVLRGAHGLAAAYGVVAAITLPLAIATLLGARRWWRARTEARWHDGARQVTVLAPPEVDPAGGQALFANLVGLMRPTWARLVGDQPHVAFEYRFSETGVRIGLWVPGVVPPGLVERAVEAAWPGAHTTTAPANAPVPAVREGMRRVVVAGQLRLARSEALPLRTDFDADPIRALIGAPVGLTGHEHACVQILARPVTGIRVRRARRAARRLHSGGSPHLVGRMLDLATPGATRPSRTRSRPMVDPQTALATSAENRAIITKQRGAQYETLIRYAALADLPHTATAAELRQARQTCRGRAHALAAAFAAYTEHNHYTRTRLRHPDTLLTARRLRRGDLLSVPELAALAHLPTDEAIPGIERAGARAIAPPPGIATPGQHAKPLGVTDTGHTRPVGLRVADARHHLHVLGATGSGKSTLLANMILADATAGRGVVVVDPKGDLVTDLLARLPRSAGDRLVLFDADSKARQPCLNPLDGGDTDVAVDNLTSIFRRVFSAFWGPRTDDVMRAACLTLRAQDGVTTLADIPRLLGEDAFRHRVVAAVTDPTLRGFWTSYDQLSEPARAQIIAPLMNKLRAFLLRPFVKHALAAGPSTVDFSDVLDGGICLVRIPKGSLGEESARLVGSLVVARTWQAATARARIPQRHRCDASLLIDECHNFLNLPYAIEDMLAEARGFHLSLTLAHQHLDQLGRELKEGISTNARSKIYFTASPEDARDLARHTEPRLRAHDLSHLGAYHAAARLVSHGQQSEPFTLRTRPLPDGVPGRARELRRAAHHSQLHHHRDRSAHEARPDQRRRAPDPRRRPDTATRS